MEPSSTAPAGSPWAAVGCAVVVYGVYAGLRQLGWTEVAGFALVAGFLFAPLWMLRGRPELARAYEVGPESPVPPWRRAALPITAIALGVVGPLFAVGFWWFYADVCDPNGGLARGVVGAITGAEARWMGAHRVEDFVTRLCDAHNGGVWPDALRLPSAWLDWSTGGVVGAVLIEVMVVALPEEVFHRGYLMSVFEARWPPTRKVLGVPMGWGVVLSCLVFAAGHLVGDLRIDRLATFFPALCFAWIWRKSGTLWAPILVHAGANLLMQVLLASTFPPA